MKEKDMRKRYLVCLALLLVLFFASGLLPASVVASQTSEGDLEAQASYVLTGSVKTVESRWDRDRKFIYSDASVTVEKALKGILKGNQVVIRYLGGEVGSVGQWTEGQPTFTEGEKVKLYLKKEQTGVYTVVGGIQGKVSLEAGQQTNPTYSWSGHHWPQTSLPINYWVNIANTPAGTLSNIQMAFQTWEDDPGSYIDYTQAGTTSATGGQDGVNVVYWGYIDGSGGIVAVTTHWYNIITLEISEFDIKFDSSDSWQIWENTASMTSFDVRNVATHEIGHTLSLGDLYDSADSRETMYGYVEWGQTTRRTLYTGDFQGLNAIYPVTYNLGTSCAVDKTGYQPGWSMQACPRITAKWIDGRTVDFAWFLYFGGQFYPIFYASGITLPEMCDMVLDVDLTMPNLGTSQVLGGFLTLMADYSTHELLGWGGCLWLYVPSSSQMPAMTPGDFAAQISQLRLGM